MRSCRGPAPGLLYSPVVSDTPSHTGTNPSSAEGSPRPGLTFAPYLATVVAALAYSFLALRRVSELRANAFDAGFIDNVLYKVASGLGDVSGLTGVSHFIDHSSVLLLFARAPLLDERRHRLSDAVGAPGDLGRFSGACGVADRRRNRAQPNPAVGRAALRARQPGGVLGDHHRTSHDRPVDGLGGDDGCGRISALAPVVLLDSSSARVAGSRRDRSHGRGCRAAAAGCVSLSCASGDSGGGHGWSRLWSPSWS